MRHENLVQSRNLDQPEVTTQTNTPLAVPVRTACNLLGIGHTTMWGLIKSGRVKTARIGRRRLIIFASLQALLSLEQSKIS
jgi:excisionase family DNA binding protein